MSTIIAEIKKEGKGQVLILTIPVKKEKSKSGKSMLIASSGGNQITELEVDGKKVVVGINAYTKID